MAEHRNYDRAHVVAVTMAEKDREPMIPPTATVPGEL